MDAETPYEYTGYAMREDLGRTITVNEYLDFFVEDSLQRKACRYVGNFLEHLLQQKLRISVPSSSQFDISCARPLSAAKRLEEIGFLSGKLTIHPRYSDEPFIYRASFGERSGGADLFSLESCLWKTVAEYLERKVWRESSEWYENRVQFGTKLEVQGIELETFAGFSPQQRAMYNHLSFNDASTFGWVQARSLIDGTARYVPAQIFSAQYARGPGAQEPLLRWPVTTGLATGTTVEDATARGALEVIERDAFMIAYLNKLSAPRVDLKHAAGRHPPLAKILERFERYNLELHVVLPPTDLGVTVAVCAIIDRSGKGPAFTVGARADFEAIEAIMSSISEALSVRISRKKTPLDKISDDIPFTSFKREEHINYWVNPQRLPLISFFTQGPLVELKQLDALHQENSTETARVLARQKWLKDLKDILKQVKCEMYAVDITPKTVRKNTNFRIVNVSSPQLIPLHLNEAIPYQWGERLLTIPKKFGYSVSSNFNSLPHPFP